MRNSEKKLSELSPSSRSKATVLPSLCERNLQSRFRAGYARGRAFLPGLACIAFLRFESGVFWFLLLHPNRDAIAVRVRELDPIATQIEEHKDTYVTHVAMKVVFTGSNWYFSDR
jgi:hypothetical protein